MKYLTLIISIIFLHGCAAVKYSPSMDKELNKEAHRYLSERELSVAAENENNFQFSNWYTYKHVDNPAGQITIIETNKQNYYEGFQCFEPMLWLITLGLVPTHCVGKHELVFKVVEDGETKTITRKVKTTTMGGWLPLLLLFSEKWEYDLNSNPYERAFISAINEQAHGL